MGGVSREAGEGIGEAAIAVGLVDRLGGGVAGGDSDGVGGVRGCAAGEVRIGGVAALGGGGAGIDEDGGGCRGG